MPIYVQDKRLLLPDGRTLAYADNGNTSSSTVVLYLHGTFGIGDASCIAPILLDKNVHFVAPSLAGWGESDAVPSPSHYSETLQHDMTALFIHLRLDATQLKIILCGYSIGTMAAQMLYGASTHSFPFRAQISSMVLLAPYSPPHCDPEYARYMSWKAYMYTGPPSRYMPFNILARLMRWVLMSKLASEALAERYVRRLLFTGLSDDEREHYTRWRESRALPEGRLETDLAGNMVRSVAHSWKGFLDVPAVYHSGWGGVNPAQPNKEADPAPVYIVAASRDPSVPVHCAEWLSRAYRNADLRIVEGSHISVLLHLDDLWPELLP